MPYNHQDCYRCLQDRELRFREEKWRLKGPNCEQSVRVRLYQCISCDGYPVRTLCHKSSQDRIIEINPDLNLWRNTMDYRLCSRQGDKLRKRRGSEVECVFDLLKRKDDLERFTIRGKAMVNMEFGLKTIDHNLRLMWQVITDRLAGNITGRCITLYEIS